MARRACNSDHVPRIAADTIADHVAQQRAAVLAAAVRLFIARGYADVSLADIAAEVGLARNSVYRYVPDKVHLLVEWYRGAVPRTITEWEDAVAGDDPAPERIKRWAHSYLRWAASPEHQLVGPLIDAVGTLDEASRVEVNSLHRSMMDVVARTVASSGTPADDVAGTVDLLAGLTLGAARAEARDPSSSAGVRLRLEAAIGALVPGP